MYKIMMAVKAQTHSYIDHYFNQKATPKSAKDFDSMILSNMHC